VTINTLNNNEFLRSYNLHWWIRDDNHSDSHSHE